MYMQGRVMKGRGGAVGEGTGGAVRVRRTRVMGGSGYWAEALQIILVHDVIIAVICIMGFIIIATVDILLTPLLRR